MQQRSGFKNILLEKKLSAINESLEKKEAQLSEVLAAANLDPNMLGSVSKKLDDVLDSKNSAIKDLQCATSNAPAHASSGPHPRVVCPDTCPRRTATAAMVPLRSRSIAIAMAQRRRCCVC